MKKFIVKIVYDQREKDVITAHTLYVIIKQSLYPNIF